MLRLNKHDKKLVIVTVIITFVIDIIVWEAIKKVF